tara:strand:+ start:14 stop:913 length:900 start_codon:yes stop_codon:yes gene_type:complete
MLGKSIRIYLKDGSVTGIKLAEVVNLTIQALSSPRNKISDLNKFFSKEINTQGVYFLIGNDDKSGKSKVYIGEAENVWERLKNHAVKKDFWSDVVLFTSKDENITKSHVKFLESRLVEITKQADRCLLDNNNKPTLSSLPLADRDSMEEFLNNIKLLNGVFGFKFLEKPIKNKISEDNIEEILKEIKDSTEIEVELSLLVKNIEAKAIQTNEGIVVLSGSQVSVKESQNYGYKTLREELISDNIIIKNNIGELIFSKDHLFQSPSSAAAVIVGYSVNGRRTWKDSQGKTLSEIEKEKIN